MSDWETIDFFTDESLVEDPYPYFDELRAAVPGAAAPPPRRRRGDRLRRAERGVPRPRHLLVVQLGRRPVRDVPGAARGRRRAATIVAEHRDQLPMHEHMVTMDPPDHTRSARC